MAKPIAPTPTLDEEDSARLLASLERRVPEHVMAMRRRAAEKLLAVMMRPRADRKLHRQ